MPKLFAGIDGGYSKTAGVLMDERGKVLARHRAGGSSIVGTPKAESCALLKGMLDELLRQALATRADLAFTGLGLNGVDYEDERAMQHTALAAAMEVPEAKLALVNDGIAALWGSSQEPAAVMVQHGSGYTSAYRSEFGGEKLFDHLNVGHIYDLRGDLITVVARMIDGREPATPLKDRVLEYFACKPEEFAEKMFRHDIPWSKRGHTPPLVYAAWERNDAAATKMVEKALDDYGLAAKTMAARTKSEAAVLSFGGGVIAQAPRDFWSRLTDKMAVLCPGCRVQGPQYPAEMGAVFMAVWHSGADLKQYFYDVDHPAERVGKGPIDCV